MYPQRKQLLHNSKKQKSQNCLKISADVVVLTGGRDTEFLVTEHDLSKRCKYPKNTNFGEKENIMLKVRINLGWQV